MVQIKKDQGIIQSLEDVKEDPLIEQVQPPCREYYELEDKEVEFPLCEEYDNPSLCVIEENDHLENEYVQHELIGEFSKVSKMNFDHPLEDVLIEKLNSFDLINYQSVNYDYH